MTGRGKACFTGAFSDHRRNKDTHGLENVSRIYTDTSLCFKLFSQLACHFQQILFHRSVLSTRALLTYINASPSLHLLSFTLAMSIWAISSSAMSASADHPPGHLVIHDQALDTDARPAFYVGQIVAVYPAHGDEESIKKAIRAEISYIAHYSAENTFVYFMYRYESSNNGWADGAVSQVEEPHLIIAPEREVFAVTQPNYGLGEMVRVYDGPDHPSEEEYPL